MCALHFWITFFSKWLLVLLISSVHESGGLTDDGNELRRQRQKKGRGSLGYLGITFPLSKDLESVHSLDPTFTNIFSSLHERLLDYNVIGWKTDNYCYSCYTNYANMSWLTLSDFTTDRMYRLALASYKQLRSQELEQYLVKLWGGPPPHWTTELEQQYHTVP